MLKLNYNESEFFDSDGWLKDGIERVAVSLSDFKVELMNFSNAQYYEQNNSYLIVVLDSDIQDSISQFEDCIIKTLLQNKIDHITDGEEFISCAQIAEIMELEGVCLENCGTSGRAPNGILWTIYLADENGNATKTELCEIVEVNN